MAGSRRKFLTAQSYMLRWAQSQGLIFMVHSHSTNHNQSPTATDSIKEICILYQFPKIKIMTFLEIFVFFQDMGQHLGGTPTFGKKQATPPKMDRRCRKLPRVYSPLK